MKNAVVSLLALTLALQGCALPPRGATGIQKNISEATDYSGNTRSPSGLSHVERTKGIYLGDRPVSPNSGLLPGQPGPMSSTLNDTRNAVGSKPSLEAKSREVLTLRVADGQWLPDAISAYLANQAQPMDLEWNAPSQFRLERGLAVYSEKPQKAVFDIVRNYGLSVCVHLGNVKPVLEVYPASSDEEKCRE